MESSPTPLNPKDVVAKILATLDVPSTIEESIVDGAPFLQITTPDPGRLIGKHGQTLSQLQFLTNRILQRHDLNAPRVTLDCEHYREHEHDDILRQAREAGDKVRRWGDPVPIGPLGAFERRVIHQHFDTDRELEAVSESGDDAGKKKITIRLRQSQLAVAGSAA